MSGRHWFRSTRREFKGLLSFLRWLVQLVHKLLLLLITQYVFLSSYCILHRPSCSCHPSPPTPSNRPGQSWLALIGSGMSTWSEQSQSESLSKVNRYPLKKISSLSVWGSCVWAHACLGLLATIFQGYMEESSLWYDRMNSQTQGSKDQRTKEKDSFPNIIWAKEPSHAWIHLLPLAFAVSRANSFSFHLCQYNVGFCHLHRQNPDKYKSDLAGTGSVLYEGMGHICLVMAIPLGSSLIIIW